MMFAEKDTELQKVYDSFLKKDVVQKNIDVSSEWNSSISPPTTTTPTCLYDEWNLAFKDCIAQREDQETVVFE